MKFRLWLIIFATLLSGAPALRAESPPASCVAHAIEKSFGTTDSGAARVHRYRERLEALTRNACPKFNWPLCRDAGLGLAQKQTLLKAAAQLEDPLAFLQAARRPKFESLLKYAEKKLEHCDPPVGSACSSATWQLVFDDYLGKKPFRRWLEDRIPERIPGLADFIARFRDKSPLEHEHTLQQNERYANALNEDGLSSRSISIVSEQSYKQSLNGVNKDFSDALGNFRREIFLGHLVAMTSDQRYSQPGFAYADFKTDRLITELNGLHDLSSRRYATLINDAAAQTDAEIDAKVTGEFPEILYLTENARPTEWFNTATFFLPGFTPKIRETLASLKARIMRTGVKLNDTDAVHEFVDSATLFNQIAARLARNQSLVTAGIIEATGTYSLGTATILRKLAKGSESEREAALVDKLRQRYPGVYELTGQDAKALLQMWSAQDLLTIPLVGGDQMKAAPKDVAILGADGVGGGAYDAWTKGNALRDHARDVGTPQGVFSAIEEGDANATRIIRAAPRILEIAIEHLPRESREKLGHVGTYISGDDAAAWLNRINQLPEAERRPILLQLCQHISDEKSDIRQSRAGQIRWHSIGPEIVRVFGGVDKPAAEAAEKLMKGFEERLAQPDALGPDWRKNYPRVAMIGWKNADGGFDVYVAGRDLSAVLKLRLQTAILSLRSAQEHVNLVF